MRIDSEVGGGTTVRLYLPRHDRAETAAGSRRRRDHAAGAGETVLLVEDEPSVRLLIAEVLRDLAMR